MNGVAIAGKAGSGKNAFARELARVLVPRGVWVTELGFAEGPKRELFERTGLRKEDPGGREALVDLAHGRRGENPDYWVNIMRGRLLDLSPYGATPIITDMRYLNELEMVRQFGFITVRIDASVLERSVVLSKRGEDPEFAQTSHASECELDEERFDLRFWNEHVGMFDLEWAAARVRDLLLGDFELVA